jgi:hypothetical protein
MANATPTAKLTFIANDGDSSWELEAETLEQALEDAVEAVSSEAGSVESTRWYSVTVARYDDDGDEIEGDAQRVTVNPDEPACEAGEEHEWSSDHDLVGGIEESPGVWGNGGGVIITEGCKKCGCQKVTDTWAQDRSTGEQGLESVVYIEGVYVDLGEDDD